MKEIHGKVKFTVHVFIPVHHIQVVKITDSKHWHTFKTGMFVNDNIFDWINNNTEYSNVDLSRLTKSYLYCHVF